MAITAIDQNARNLGHSSALRCNRTAEPHEQVRGRNF
jgi:hypothetical protein